MRVFVYEHLSGIAPAGPGADEALLAAGRAMRDAVVADLSRLDHCEVSYAARREEGPPRAGARALHAPAGVVATDFVAQQARLHDRMWVIAPESGGLLARLQRAVGASRWIGCGAGAIALASSKTATLAYAERQGLATPRAFAVSPEPRRWVVKPDDGAGAIDTCLHATWDAASADAAGRRRRGEAVAIEAWVEGEPLSLSLMCRAGRDELLSVNRQRIEVAADGTIAFAGVEIDAVAHDDARFEQLRAWSHALTRAIAGLRGYVGVDLVWHAQRGPVLIEVNPRVTMAYVGLSEALGRNCAAAVLAAHEREPSHAAA